MCYKHTAENLKSVFGKDGIDHEVCGAKSERKAWVFDDQKPVLCIPARLPDVSLF